MKTRHLLFTLLISATLPLQAGVMYKWVDAEGQVHYGEMPPPGVKASEIRYHVKPATTTQPQPAVRKKIRVTKKPPRKVNKPRTMTPELRRACDQAEANLAQLKSGLRIRLWDKKKGFYFLSDAERQKRISDATIFLSKFCKESR